MIQTILDEGTVRDGAGKVVDFTYVSYLPNVISRLIVHLCRNCIVIITTSIGQAAAAHTHLREHERDLYHFAIRAHFPAEFLSRIDDVIVFVCHRKPLILHPTNFFRIVQRRTTEDLMPAIVASRLDDLASQLSRVRLGLEVTEAAQEYLCQAGWSSTSGAQNLESVIREGVLQPLSGLILHDRIKDSATVRVDCDHDDDGFESLIVCSVVADDSG